MKLHKGLVLELDITDLAFGGKGIGKIKKEETRDKSEKEALKDFVVFVDGALPGQKVEARISVKKRRHAEAKLVKVLQRSPDETDTPYQEVPGAPWARLPLALQQQHKQNQVFELFRKFAQIDLASPPQLPFARAEGPSIFDEYVSSPQAWHYRNKMEYSFGPTTETFVLDPGIKATENIKNPGIWKHNGFGLGSKKRGQFWLVENLEKPSGLFDEAFENLLPAIKAVCQASGLEAYNSRTNQGFWRQITVRKSWHEDSFLVDLVTNLGESDAVVKPVIDLLQSELGDRLKGLLWTQSDNSGNPCAHYQSRTLLCGEDILVETLSKLSFQISIDSFFQTNVHSAQNLYAKALSYLGESKANTVLDLFCGTGTISQLVAQKFPTKKVVGVEIVEAAVTDAKANAQLNNLTNTEFVAADVLKFLKESRDGAVDQADIIVDPPRAGIAPKALAKIIEFAPQTLVYVSCNPATMARDAATLAKAGYQLSRLSLVDQFPHTSHVECVGKFESTAYEKNTTNAPT